MDQQMDRLKELRKYVDKALQNCLKDPDDLKKAYVHLYGVSLASVLICKRRGLGSQEVELCAMAAMLHDLAAYESGSYDDHAHRGADRARELLEELKLTSAEETEKICSAIYHHDDKAAVDSPMDECLKDADVIHHTMDNPNKAVKEKELKRYQELLREFGVETA